MASHEGSAIKRSWHCARKGEPKHVALWTGAVVVGVIILMKLVRRRKEGMLPELPTGRSNLRIAGMRPMWQNGSQHAGWDGTVERPVTKRQMGIYQPNLNNRTRRLIRRRTALKRLRAAMGREGFFPVNADGSCPPGSQKWVDSATGAATCLTAEEIKQKLEEPDEADEIDEDVDNEGYDWDGSSCGEAWDPAATAEGQALAVVGALEGSTVLGENRLMRSVDAAYDTGSVLTDAQLVRLMRGSDTP